MSLLSSAHEVLKITTSRNSFLVLGMTGEERLGRLPQYTIELVGAVNSITKQHENVKLHDLLGTRATLTMDVAGDKRYFSGYITRMRRGEARGRHETFTAVLQPWLWFLTRTRNSRVFQNKSVKDIVADVLGDYSTDFAWRLVNAAAYPKLDYCVQYDETDFDFVSRLLEDAGIYYFFEHSSDKHTMVLIDSMAKHKSRAGSGAVKWSTRLGRDTAGIVGWMSQEEARSVKAVVSDYDYLSSTTDITASKPTAKPPHKMGSMEWFEHPANVAQNSAKEAAQPAGSAMTHRAGVRMEELVSMYASSSGRTSSIHRRFRSSCAGHVPQLLDRFSLLLKPEPRLPPCPKIARISGSSGLRMRLSRRRAW